MSTAITLINQLRYETDGLSITPSRIGEILESIGGPSAAITQLKQETSEGSITPSRLADILDGMIPSGGTPSTPVSNPNVTGGSGTLADPWKWDSSQAPTISDFPNGGYIELQQACPSIAYNCEAGWVYQMEINQNGMIFVYRRGNSDGIEIE